MAVLPAFLLGVEYPPTKASLDDESDEALREEFRRDFHSLIWITYRRGFVPIAPTNLTSDSGWGCMLRCGQMMLAQACVRHLLGRDWRMDDETVIDQYYNIVRWFHDHPRPSAPYCIHNVAQGGLSLGKGIGEWFGPSTAVEVLKSLFDLHMGFAVGCYVGRDATIYEDEVARLAYDEVKESFKPIVVFVPLRLGLASINAAYVPALKATLTYSQTLGIVGGKPRSAFYFVGFEDNSLFYLDPHTTQKVVEENSIDTGSYHCRNVKRISVSDIDTSLALGFYCRTLEEWDDLVVKLKSLVVDDQGSPLVTVVATRPPVHEVAGVKDECGLSDEDDFEML